MIPTIRLSDPWIFTTLSLFLLGVPVFAEAAAAPKPAPPRIAGVVVRVTDLDKALEFYRDVAGFEPVRVDRAAGRADLSNGELRLWLLQVGRLVRHEPGDSEAHLNVQVEKLDDTLAELGRRGVPKLLDKPLVAVIGPNMPITDPSGNILYLVQLNSQKAPLPRPKVFNFGITVPDMAEARSFYEGLLGFQVATEAFYPPVIPYVPAGALQVVLHESASRAGAPPSPDTAQMNLILEVVDLDAARRDLAARGGRLRPADPSAALGAHAELLDPFGNVHLLVARSASRDSR